MNHDHEMAAQKQAAWAAQTAYAYGGSLHGNSQLGAQGPMPQDTRRLEATLTLGAHSLVAAETTLKGILTRLQGPRPEAVQNTATPAGNGLLYGAEQLSAAIGRVLQLAQEISEIV